MVLRAPVARKELLAFAAARLRHHRPRLLLVLDALPRNALGKVLNRVLQERLLACGREGGPAPSRNRRGSPAPKAGSFHGRRTA